MVEKMKAGLAYRKGIMAHKEATDLNNKGKYKEAKAKSDVALEQYKKAYRLGCREATLLIATGLILMREGDFAEAKKLFLEAEKLPKIRPEERVRLRNNYAILLWKTGRLDDAIEQMHIIEQSGKTSFVYGTLGYLLIEKGQYEEAEKFNLEGLEYDDEDSVVLDNLGQLYLRMGDRDKAKEYFVKAHEQREGQIDTLYYLAKLAAEDGDKAQAAEYLEHALEANFTAMCTVTRPQVEELYRSVKE